MNKIIILDNISDIECYTSLKISGIERDKNGVIVDFHFSYASSSAYIFNNQEELNKVVTLLNTFCLSNKSLNHWLNKIKVLDY